MDDTQVGPPPFGIWTWCALLLALEPIAEELAHTYVRRHPDAPMRWSTLHQLELEALDRLEGLPKQDPGLLALLRSDIVTMGLPKIDEPVILNSDHFVPVVAAEIWRAYRRLKDLRHTGGLAISR
ncbi:hypothetical protein [Burkholderia gladioli]|uniref:Uncharacterized protein n=1 Tax=Burkholderia gladioli TaxID=28095 RepID=A0A2A7SAW9_BURGA|nr:hypothetical protein [Burkholderia gladioli]MBU9383751.1 hypothetical protein [Burkholderia gladioli]MBU9425077.1 hypothetical protein [Burkholderia gladioli]MDN7917829.1 hypothetical protein [Burkholderia gladioli]MDN8062313.1 hypothetical protein [Burkholderia gladioli]PEH40854.1 hypothetical protein CRM94_00995 [Burkholderia gladioli]